MRSEPKCQIWKYATHTHCNIFQLLAELSGWNTVSCPFISIPMSTFKFCVYDPVGRKLLLLGPIPANSCWGQMTLIPQIKSVCTINSHAPLWLSLPGQQIGRVWLPGQRTKHPAVCCTFTPESSSRCNVSLGDKVINVTSPVSVVLSLIYPCSKRGQSLDTKYQHGLHSHNNPF